MIRLTCAAQAHYECGFPTPLQESVIELSPVMSSAARDLKRNTEEGPR